MTVVSKVPENKMTAATVKEWETLLRAAVDTRVSLRRISR